MSVSSPVTTCSNPKKLSTVSKGKKSLSIHDDTNKQKQAAVESPGQEQQTIVQVVIATKQSKESSKEEE